MKAIIRFQKSALITYAGIGAAVVGLLFVADPLIALMCLVLCAICDMFDGAFARHFKRSEFEMRFGIAIDALADVLAFIALPVAIFMSTVPLGAMSGVVLVYALAGITRLAVFVAESSPGKKTEYYRGVPVTVAGIIIPAVYAMVALVNHDMLAPALGGTYLVFAILFILDIKVKKP